MLCSTSFFPVVTCAVPVISNAIAYPHDVTSFEYSDVISVLCKPGFLFVDGASAHSVECGADGEWSSRLPPCIGELTWMISYCTCSYISYVVSRTNRIFSSSETEQCSFAGNVYSVGDVIEVQDIIDPGFERYSSHCLSGGKWSIPPQESQGFRDFLKKHSLYSLI